MIMRLYWVALFVCFTSLFSGCTQSWEQSATRRITTGKVPAVESLDVPLTNEPIQIDGHLNETAWESAATATLTDFWNQGSDVQLTEVLLLHSSTHLYIAFNCRDQHILSKRTEHDDQTFRDDCVEVFVGRPKNKIWQTLGMEINANGVTTDFWYRHRNWINYSWNPETIKVSAEKLFYDQKLKGYVVELSIPFNELSEQLKIPMPVSELRMNFARVDRPSGYMTIWSNPDYVRPHPHFPNRYGWIRLISDEKLNRS